MMQDVQEMRAIVRGKVQGVGFRTTVTYHATILGITGSVCNLPDGRVEIHAQGTQEILEQLVDKLKRNAGLGHVDGIDIEYFQPSQRYERFAIVHSSTSYQS